MKHIICSFLQPALISSFFDPNVFLSILFTNARNLRSSLNVRDHAPQPYKTTEKLIVLYILIFTFHLGNDKASDFELNDNKNFPDLIIIIIIITTTTTCKG
jgi:hypothetical protein